MDSCEDLNLKQFHDDGDDADAEVNKVDMKRIYIYIIRGRTEKCI